MGEEQQADPPRERWARLRFAIVGPLLAAPPAPGELQEALARLAARRWQHPSTGEAVRFGVSTIERWYYAARNARDPIAALRRQVRADAGRQRGLGAELRARLHAQHGAHPSWSVQLHYDNLAAQVAETPALGPLPTYATVRR